MKAITRLRPSPFTTVALSCCLFFWAILPAAFLVMVKPCPAQVPLDENVITNGDLNLDGVFDELDLIQLGRSVFLDLALSGEEVETCDVDGDRKLTNYDLLVISDAYNSVQGGEIEMFDAIALAIRKDLVKGGDNVETYLDLARFYRKEKQLESARGVLESILESLDTRHPLYEVISSLRTQIDNEETSQQLIDQIGENVELFRASDDLEGKVSLRRMVLRMKGNLSNILKDSQFAGSYNSKKVKLKLNAVMENMLHKLAGGGMVDPADFTKFNQDVRRVLEDPANIRQNLSPEQKNRLFGEVNKSTTDMRDQAMQLRQKIEKQEAARRQAIAQQRASGPEEILDRRDWDPSMDRRNRDFEMDRKIVANTPTISPDTVSIVAPEYFLEWDISNVLGAKGAALEISHKNSKFQNPRGTINDKENDLFYKPGALTAISGKLNLSALKLEGVGNYQYRVAAVNAEGQLMSRFSDAANLVVVFNNVNTIANKPVLEPPEVTLSDPKYTIHWNVSNVDGAKNAAVEISKPNAQFSNPNGRKPDRINAIFYNSSLGSIMGKSSASIEGLAGPGEYLFRVVAVSPEGDFIGRWSDPETLTVRSEAPEEEPAEVAGPVVPDPPEVSLSESAAVISWDVSRIPGVNGILLEVSPAGSDSSNAGANPGNSPEENSYNQEIIGTKGSLTVNFKDLEGEGNYLARVAAIDTSGSMLGLWSTPTEVRVFSSPAAAAQAQAQEVKSTPTAEISSTRSATFPAVDDMDLADKKKLMVTRKSVPLYRDMALTSPKVTTLVEGDLLYLVKSNTPWYHVFYPEKRKKGWILVYDVKEIE